MSKISEIMTDQDKILGLEEQLSEANAYIVQLKAFLTNEFEVAVYLRRFGQAAEIEKMLDKAPKQSLLLHDADVISALATDMYDYDIYNDHDAFKACKVISQKLREQAKGAG